MRYLTALLTRSKKSSALRATNVLQFKRRRRRLFVEQLEDRRLLATFTVINIADSGAGSLRQAIVDANGNSGSDIIQFDSGVNGTITLTTGELAITGAVDLQGPGSSIVTVSGNNSSRVFYVSANATISGLTISGGNSDYGGGIYNDGTLTLESSTLSGNSASGSGSYGGGVYTLHSSTLTVVSSTLSANTAGYNRGGGIYLNSSGTSTLNNTIVAANYNDDIHGAIASSSSHNLIGVNLNLSGISHGSNGNQVGTTAASINPLLGALQDNGGPTETLALLPGSPAINAGNNSLIPVGVTTDQRGTGFARIDSGIVDIGAFERVLNRPPVANPGGPYSIAEGSSLLLNGSGSYDPDPLDILTYSWDVNGDGVFGDAIGVSPTLTWAQLQAIGINDGPRTVPNVRVRVDDGHAHVVDSPVTMLTVTNVAPTVGVIIAPVDPTAVTTTINVSSSFTDIGTRDTHTASWNWGDSTSSAGAITETNGSGSVSGSHAYTAAGVYTVTLTVTDDDTGVGSSTFQYIVVYDPSAGFVTGGGWINSPIGAYAANPELATSRGLLTQESLNQAVDQAINYWSNMGVDASAVSNLQQIHVEIADLSDDELGIASDTNYVWIDRDAAGYGWQPGVLQHQLGIVGQS